MRTRASLTLLSIEQDAKTIKGTASGWLTGVVYLAPSTEARADVDLCTSATEECRKACLNSAGMAGVFPSIRRARVERTLWYLDDPAGFMERLRAEIRGLVDLAAKRGLRPAVRINGTSDLPKLARTMAKEFPDVQFYDYTKHPRPWQRTMANYHLTFSHSGENMAACRAAMAHGVNVAVVFSSDTDLPASWNGWPVVNGDANDLRFLDPAGVVVGLKAKGKAKQIETGGFVQIGAVA